MEAVLVALLSEGNVLIEGVPGLGKTLLVNTLSRVLSCEFRRIQFTPDLMPSDITGHSIYDMKENEFNFNPGPLFTNLLLADEINRAPGENAVGTFGSDAGTTGDGRWRHLSARTPHSSQLPPRTRWNRKEPTPLPEAQLDRFMFKLLVDYPTQEQENDILGMFASGKDNRQLDQFGLSDRP